MAEVRADSSGLPRGAGAGSGLAADQEKSVSNTDLMDLDVTASTKLIFRKSDFPLTSFWCANHLYDNPKRIVVFALGKKQLYRQFQFWPDNCHCN